jgi:hypothetical protein
MGSGSNDVETKDLQTPTLKGEHYTTGRGGTQHSISRRLRRAAISDRLLIQSFQARETS